MASTPSSSFRVSPIAKIAFQAQMFMLRHNLMGPVGDMIMIITVKGRKTGKEYSTPIGYVRDGETIYALNNAGYSNWYRNVLQNPEVILEIKGQKFGARAQAINDPNERHQIFNLYKQQRAGAFQRFFGVPVDAPESELERALESRVFVRFTVNG
jgi:deazaflavin-dependent oxidoreductase (nitroreductase family)